MILFCGAQMHSTVPNTSGVCRYSIDFRTVNLDDAVEPPRRGQCDSASTGTTMRDYLRATDLSHIPESVVAMYDDGTERDGLLVYPPAGRAAFAGDTADRPAAVQRSLAGQLAVVTGASSGIGRAIALALADEGMALRLVGRDTDRLEAVARLAKAKSRDVGWSAVDLPGQSQIEATRPSSARRRWRCWSTRRGSMSAGRMTRARATSMRGPLRPMSAGRCI